MHLGRFHATIYDLSLHFKKADLATKLEQCAAALDQYSQTRDPTQLDTFRSAFGKLLKSAEVTDSDIKQPYAQQVIAELSINDFLDPNITNTFQQIVSDRSFDHAGIASDFRALGVKLNTKVTQLKSIDSAFSELDVEFERVKEEQAEVGILLPREVVGESLSALTSEFGKLGTLFRAINELTGSTEYDPKVRTISSSWWQIFLDMDPTQTLVWIVSIERIVALFKSNLEIKDLQQRLSSKDMPKQITDLIENEIDKRVSTSLEALAADLRRDYSKIQDQGRLNEVETQLRQGLYHLAMRINQGAQVEINVSVPDEPEELPSKPEDEAPSQEIQSQIAAHRARIAELRELRMRGRSISTETLKIDGESQALLKYFSQSNEAINDMKKDL